MKKTGIMGGSFNPIHVGHLEIAECAWKEYGLDEILFIPNYCPPHKDSSEMLDAKSRLDMVKLAIQGHPNYTVTDREIQKGGLSYTYLTINELKAEEPDTEFYFLMGADSLADFRKWSHAEVIASKCHIFCLRASHKEFQTISCCNDSLKSALCCFHQFSAEIQWTSVMCA